MTTTADAIFDQALSWLRDTYSSHHFFVERDVVWILQKRLIAIVAETSSPLQVFNDYPVVPGKRRSLSADLTLVNASQVIELAAEFKYEPNHRRADIQPQKLPVVYWGIDGVGKDVVRVHEFVEQGRVKLAYSIFIDEGGAFRHRPPHPGSEWIDWENGVSILFSRVVAGTSSKGPAEVRAG